VPVLGGTFLTSCTQITFLYISQGMRPMRPVRSLHHQVTMARLFRFFSPSTLKFEPAQLGCRPRPLAPARKGVLRKWYSATRFDVRFNAPASRCNNAGSSACIPRDHHCAGPGLSIQPTGSTNATRGTRYANRVRKPTSEIDAVLVVSEVIVSQSQRELGTLDLATGHRPLGEAYRRARCL